MSSLFDRKLWRELRSSKLLMLSIISIIALGMACYLCMISTYQNLEFSRDHYYSRCQMADFSIEVKKAPNQVLEALRDIPGISALRTRILFHVVVDVKGVEEPLGGQVISMPAERKPVINDIVLLQGSYFSPTRINEVIISDGFARGHKLSPGDTIKVILNNQKRELVIVGTAISSEFVYITPPGSLLPDPKKYTLLYLKRPYVEKVFNFQDSANQVLGLVEKSHGKDVDTILKKAEKGLNSYGVFSTTPRKDMASHSILSSELQGLKSMATLLPFVFLMVAAFILNILMRRLIEQQRTTIGTLKALGYGNGTLFFHYLQFGLVVALGGGILGTLLGQSMAGGMTAMYRQYFSFPVLYIRVYPYNILMGFLIGLFFSLVGVFRGIRKIRLLNPAESMRPPPPPRGGGIFLERIPFLWNLLGVSWRMALRSIFRNPSRSLTTVLVTGGASALLISGFFMYDASDFFVEFQYRKILHSDCDLSFKDEQSRRALLEVLRLKGVDYVEPFLQVAATLEHGPYRKKGVITGLIGRSRLRTPLDREGRKIVIPEQGLVLTGRMAYHLRTQVGDTLQFTPIKGRKKTRSVKVVSIVEEYVGVSVYAHIDYLSSLIDEEFALSGAMVKVDPRYWKAFKKQTKDISLLSGTTELYTEYKTIREIFVRNMMVMIYMIILFAGIIAFGSILNHSLICLSERKRQISTMRVMGYTPWEVGGIFLRENLLLNMMGALVGLPLGWLLSYGMVFEMTSDFYRFPLVIYPRSYFLTILLCLVFSLVTHLYVQRKIGQVNWIQELNVRE